MKNSTPIFSALQKELGPDTIQQISQKLGTDPDNVSKAISVAVPILLNGLSRNVSSSQGASDLDQALGDHDGSILDNLGGLLGNPGGGAGAGILGHILGGRRTPVEQGMGRATGLNAQQVSQLLMMLAPLVMGILGRMKRQQGVGANQLPQVLDQSRIDLERQLPPAASLGRVLDRNQDGQIADDIARIGSSLLGWTPARSETR